MVLNSQSGLRRWLLLGALLLALLLILCTCNGSNRIQTDLRERGAFALGEGGYDASFLTVDGRDATLSGVVTSAAAQGEMVDLVSGVRGMRIVNDNLRVEAAVPAEPADLVFSTFNGEVNLSGTVPEEARADLLEAATSLYGNDVVDNLTVSPDAATPWLGGVLDTLPQLGEATNDVELRIQDDGLTLAGSAISEEAKADLGAALGEATQLPVQNELEVLSASAEIDSDVANAETAETETNDGDTAEGGVADAGTVDADADAGTDATETDATETDAGDAAASNFSLQLDTDGVNLTGSVDAATRDALLGASDDLVGAERVKDDLDVAEGVVAPTWLGKLTTLLPRLNDEVTGAGIELDGDQLALRGEVASEAQRTELEEALRSTVGPEVTVLNELTVAEATAEAAVEDAASDATEDAAIEDAAVDDAALDDVAVDDAENIAESNEVAEAADTAEATDETSTESAAEDETEAAVDTQTTDAETASDTPSDTEVTEDAAADTIEDTTSEQPATEEASAEAGDADSEATPELVESDSADATEVNEATAEADNTDTTETDEPASTDTDSATNSAETDIDADTTDADANAGVESMPPAETEAAALRAPDIRVALLGDTVELTGSVASEEERALAETAFPDKTVDNRLSIDPQVRPTDWLGDLYDLSTRVDGNVTRGVLDLSDDRLTLRGTVASDAMRGAVGDYVGDAMHPNLSNGIDNLLEVQPLIPFTEDGK